MTPTPADTLRWTRLWLDTSLLLADAATVIGLRTLRMMSGGLAATREADRMVREKVEAGYELAGALASGQLRSPEAAARRAVTVYGKRVRANRRRLG